MRLAIHKDLLSNQHLRWRRVAKECRGARGEAVSSRLENHDQIADIGLRHFHVVGEQVERRAKRADHRSDFALTAYYLVADYDRIVLAYHLSEVPRRGEMVMQAAVGHQEYLAARDLAVDDSADINARFTD